MASEDLRLYLTRIEAAGKLKRIVREVDSDWEISAICRSVWRHFSYRDRFALLFESVKGRQGRVVVGAFGQSKDLYAMALGVTPDGIYERWSEAMFLFPRLGFHPLDPSIAPHEQHIGGKGEVVGGQIEWPAAMVIDATRKSWFPPVGKDPEANLRAIEERWEEYGLPPFGR